MSNTAAKLTRLTGREWRDLGRAKLALARALLLLRTSAKGSLLAPSSALSAAPLTPEQRRRASAIGWAITRAAHYGFVRPKCLARSLALQQMLAREGIEGSQLHLGVRPVGDSLQAHAWITLEGRVLGDEAAFVAGFTELPGTKVAHLL